MRSAARGLVLAGLLAGPAQAQSPSVSDEQCEQQASAVARTASQQALAAHNAAIAGDRAGAYKIALAQALDDFEARVPECVQPMLRARLAAELEQKRQEAKQQAAANPSFLPRSFEAAASNPAAVRSLEPAGLVNRLGLAVGSANFLSADKSAVTLTLGGLGLHKSGCEVLPAASCYQDAGALTKLSGSFTFGAKLPEKDITGFSGLPDAEKLFDAIAWDVKWRLVGDRDPRARRWNPLLLDQAGGALWREAKLLNGLAGSLPPTDLPAAQAALSALANEELAGYNDTIGRSLVVTLKLSGQHLSQEKGKDKYAGTLLLDAGLGKANLTFNGGYSVVEDVQAGSVGPAFKLKTWAVAGGLSGSFWRDQLVKDRSAEWTLSGKGSFPADGSDVPVDRKATWQMQLALTFPVTGTANLPISVSFASDPNSLGKQKYVRGLIGINYDFGGLKELLKKGS